VAQAHERTPAVPGTSHHVFAEMLLSLEVIYDAVFISSGLLSVLDKDLTASLRFLANWTDIFGY